MSEDLCAYLALPLFHSIAESFELEGIFQGHLLQLSCNEQGQHQPFCCRRAIIMVGCAVLVHLVMDPEESWMAKDTSH